MNKLSLTFAIVIGLWALGHSQKKTAIIVSNTVKKNTPKPILNSEHVIKNQQSREMKKMSEITGSIFFDEHNGLFSFYLDPSIKKQLKDYFIQVQAAQDSTFKDIVKVYLPVLNVRTTATFGSITSEKKELRTIMVKPNKQLWPIYLRFMICLKEKKDNIKLESCKYFPLNNSLRVVCAAKMEYLLMLDN